MTPEVREKQIVKNMKLLGISRKEAEELIADDEAVDRGEPLPWDLTPEQLAVSRKARQADRSVSNKSQGPRKKKEDPVKREIINTLFQALSQYENANITNPEQKVDFEVGGVQYTVSLTAHRKK